jgi:GntR family transcriptional regulator, transcriptional repressor for pyruvate dehydrogenase complex
MSVGPKPELDFGIEGALSGEPVDGLGSVLEPVQLRNAAEQIAERLVTAIALGEFVPGQRLPTERELETMLDVNRRSIREAMHSLEGAGYVEIRRGRNGGAYVRSAWGPRSAEMVRRTLLPNWRRFEWLFDLRRLVESLIAQAAAERWEEDDGPNMTAALDAYIAAENDREASRAADQALHTAVARATQNPYLARLSMQLRAQVSLGFQAEPFSARLRERAIEQHAALVAAVLERRGDDAAAIAREHFGLTEGALRELIDRAVAEQEQEKRE